MCVTEQKPLWARVTVLTLSIGGSDMTRILRLLVPLLTVVSLIAVDGSALAQPKDKDRKEQKVKHQKHQNGKDLVGDKIKKDGKHAFHQSGKNTAYADVKGGKIAGVTVTHAEK